MERQKDEKIGKDDGSQAEPGLQMELGTKESDPLKVRLQPKGNKGSI